MFIRVGTIFSRTKFSCGRFFHLYCNKMENISNVSTEEMGKSNFVRPYRVRYTQNGKQKVWDCIQAHDSVAILIHHIEHDTFVVVRQFRPAVYVCDATSANGGKVPSTVDSTVHPGTSGVTYELCAGIIDKDESVLEIARQEVLEECGYDVPAENMELITRARSGVGISGTHQTLYYARITEDMKKTEGGGNVNEGEMIHVAEIPVRDSVQFAFDETKCKPLAMSFALLWYHSMKAKSGQLT